MESGLEVVGRHAMLFDDDAALSFTNSKEALIEWNNSLFIDRFDVRNLLTNPPASFRNLPSYYHSSSILPDDDAQLQSDLDRERYADLTSSPLSSPNHQLENESEAELKDAGGYHFVPFSYGSPADISDQKNSDTSLNSSVFYPPFPVPENLLQNLPPTEKVHQIMARTATFVGQHGGQSEIVLRVKQGDNPTFGFLMPHHQLHPYFRYLVDHPEVLKDGKDMESQDVNRNGNHNGGALSLLGSVYGSGEDDDIVADVDEGPQQTDSGVTSSAAQLSKSSQSEQVTSGNVIQKEETSSTLPQTSKTKVPSLSKLVLNSFKPASGINKDRNVLSSTHSSLERPQAPSLFPLHKVEKSILDPPSEVKRLVDRIVEILIKNGKDFEAVLIEQDKKVGKFPFLLPSNQYHPYYLNILQKALESRLNVKSFSSGKDGLTYREVEKETVHSTTEEVDDLLLDDDKKEKFKMVIGKSKKDSQDQVSKDPQRQCGYTVDTAAAAAILQAATRGVGKPNLKFFSKASHSSQQQNLALKETGESSDTHAVDKDTAIFASHVTAGEADSSETRLNREQKLKAERLRRAKMFAAMIRSGAAPLGAETPRALSAEPAGSELSGSAAEAVNEKVKNREADSDPKDSETANNKKPLNNSSDDENDQVSRTRRHYRSRKPDESEGEEEGEEKRVGDKDDEEDPRRSRKRHGSHHSSQHHRDRSKERHKHGRRHSPSKSRKSSRRDKRESSSSLEDDRDRHRRHKHNNSAEEEHKRLKRRNKHDDSSEDEYKQWKRSHRHDSSSEDEHKQRKRSHRHDSSSEDEHKHLKRGHKHENSSEDEHKQRKRTHKHSRNERKSKGRSKKDSEANVEEADLEEGEIRPRFPVSAVGGDASREVSVDASKSPNVEPRISVTPSETTEISEDLRAKIRAMLRATM